MHPFGFYPLSLWIFERYFTSRRLSETKRVAAPSRFAVCVCAYNEERVIDRKARNLLSLRAVFPDIELLVYIDAATDQTAQLLRSYGDQITVVESTERHGKTYGMNLLASMTQAEIIIFNDANTLIDIDSIRNLPDYFADASVGCVSANLQYLNADDSSTADTGATYWRIEESIKRLENACGGAMGADGAMFAVRKTLYEPTPVHLIDDFHLSMKLIIGGARVIQAHDVIVYERSASDKKEEFSRKIRIGCQALNVHRALSKDLRHLDALTQYKYVSHKLIRWLSGLLFVLSLVMFELGLLITDNDFLALAVIASVFAGYALGSWLSVSPFSKLWEIFLSLIATSLGVGMSVGGKNFQTWSPPASARSDAS